MQNVNSILLADSNFYLTGNRNPLPKLGRVRRQSIPKMGRVTPEKMIEHPQNGDTSELFLIFNPPQIGEHILYIAMDMKNGNGK